MRAGKHLERERQLFLFQLKNVRKLLAVPVILLFAVIPLVLCAVMKKYGDIYYVEENFVILTQYLVPLMSVWGMGFAFVELIEADGEEIHYVNHRMKDNLVLLWLLLYLAVVALGCAVAGIWVGNVWLEYMRMAISSCFYTSLFFCVMFWSDSMTVPFLAVSVYWLASIFGNQVPFDWLNCYDTRFMSVELLFHKYVYIMLAAVLLYLAGYVGNRRKQRYH